MVVSILNWWKVLIVSDACGKLVICKNRDFRARDIDANSMMLYGVKYSDNHWHR